VTLSDVCKSNEFCDIGGEPNNVFYNGTNFNATCKTTPSGSSSPLLRYPGESCGKDSECWKPDSSRYNDTLVGTCLYGYCRGYNTTQNCSETAWCWVGNYCANDGKCAPLKKQNENCTLTTECQNGLLCLKGKCANAWFSLSANTVVEGDLVTDASHYCIFNRAYKGVCDYFNSTDTVDSKSGLVTCTPGQKCNYTSLSGPSTLDCQCGYNSDGLSYCPKGNNQSKNNKIINIFIFYFLF
jgi:hypothetical protein